MDDCNKGAAAAQLTVVSTLCVCVSLLYTQTLIWGKGYLTWESDPVNSAAQPE